MRFVRMLLGGLIGAIPGVALNYFSGENLAFFFGTVLLTLVGAIIGATIGWKRSGTSNTES